MTLVPVGSAAQLDPIQLVLDSVSSPLTKKAYRKALEDFFHWWSEQGRPPLIKAVVQRYVSLLVEQGRSPASVNLRLSALRKLVREAADNGLLGTFEAESIARVKGIKKQGRRTGTWLSRVQAQALLLAPDTKTLRGLRDRALLAVLLGCGLRRSELQTSPSSTCNSARAAGWCSTSPASTAGPGPCRCPRDARRRWTRGRKPPD